MKKVSFILPIALLSVVFCFSQTSVLKAPLNSTPTELVAKVFEGEWDKETAAVKWKPGIADIFEFNGTIGNEFLYTRPDTAFTYGAKGDETLTIICHTNAMQLSDEGKMENANSCHVCGTMVSVLEFSVREDGYYLNKVIKTLGSHGTFGSPEYKLTPIDLGNGYRLLKVDDPYSGMGMNSVATMLYDGDRQVLHMISEENNAGAREPKEKGYYEFKTKFTFNKKTQEITAMQTGYRLDEKTGKRTPIQKVKKWKYDGFTISF